MEPIVYEIDWRILHGEPFTGMIGYLTPQMETPFGVVTAFEIRKIGYTNFYTVQSVGLSAGGKAMVWNPALFSDSSVTECRRQVEMILKRYQHQMEQLWRRRMMKW